jgi:hypothetical protein
VKSWLVEVGFKNHIHLMVAFAVGRRIVMVGDVFPDKEDILHFY